MKRINKWTLLLTASYCVLAVGCKDDEGSYLVRETDIIQFSSNLASSQRITLRCNGAWRSVVPEDAQWLSTTPSEGVGTGEFEWITVSATHNRSAERTATLYLECNGVQYPITVTQANGAIIYGTPTLDGNLIEGEASEASIRFTYSNAYGDETIAVKCTPSGDCDGLSVAGTSFELTNGGATLALDIEGTPDETRIRHLRRERRRSADRRGARQGLLRQRNARRRTARTVAFQRNHGRRSRKNGSAKASARVDDRQTYAQLRCRFGHHHGRRSRRQNRDSTELMGLQQRPCLHQRSLLQRLLADDHSGQIRRFGHRPQCERLLRRIGFGRSVLPARILG